MLGILWPTTGLFGEVHTWILLPLSIVLSVAVSVHVLLRKRDIGSAIGWIGLAWLSPFAGCFAYFILGINRVERRARRLRRRARRRNRRFAARDRDIARHLVPLEAAAGRLTHRPAEADNGIEVMTNGDAAYPIMLAAIEAAEKSVAMASYIFFLDQAGRRFTDALAAAKSRGVEVRVLVDGVGSGYFRSRVYNELRRQDVKAARFLHSVLPWRMPFLNLRTHKKILVVDGRIGFTGGMNIAAQNVLARDPKNPVKDIHFRFDGPIVAQLMDDFARDWDFTTGETLEGDIWFPDQKPGGPAVARVITSGPDDDLEKIEFVIMEAVACAKQSIRIVTPYFLPEERLLTSVAIAAIRGVSVDIVVPEVSDHKFIDWAMRAHVAPLIEAGARIWLNPPPFEHTKILVIDDDWCLIGSANWDTRSLRLNFELSVEVYHDELAQHLAEMTDARKAKRLTLDDIRRRSLPVRLRDAATRLFLPYL